MLTTKEQQLLVREVYKTMKRKKGMTLAMMISYYRDCADFLEEVALNFLEEVALNSQNH